MGGYTEMFYVSLILLILLWLVYIPIRIWMGIQSWNFKKKAKEKSG